MPRKKNKGWTVREQELDNKSRKGLYVYIKKAGKRASYYKVKDIPLQGNFDYYVSLYEGNIGRGRKGVTKRREKVRKSLTHDDLIQRAKTSKKAIDKIIGRGIWSTQLEGAFNKSPHDIKETYKELLFKAILSRDPRTLDILTQSENIQKFKNRFEFKIRVVDSLGNTLAYLEHIGKKDIEEVISDMRTYFNKGKNIDTKYDAFTARMRNLDYTYKPVSSGTVHNINFKIIMKKGR